MPRIKFAIGLLLYIASCMGLLIAPAYISLSLTAYSTDFPASHGPRIPAFSTSALSVMPHATAICFTILAASLLLAFLAFRRVKEQDTRLYWIGVLANLNYYTVLILFGLVLIGFFFAAETRKWHITIHSSRTRFVDRLSSGVRRRKTYHCDTAVDQR